MASLEGVHAKLDRARKHLEEFRFESEQLLGAYRDTVELSVEDGGRVHIYRLGIVPPVPPHWGPLVGDILHNLRTALDHLAWQLVLLSEGQPNRRLTKYPILTDRPQDEEPPSIRGGLSRGIREELVHEQPYTFPDPQKAPLRFIQRLNNIDKHEVVVPIVTVLRSLAWDKPQGIDFKTTAWSGPLYSGDELATHTFTEPSEWSPDPSFNFGLRLHPNIDYPEGRTGDFRDWGLAAAASTVETIVRRFESDFMAAEADR